VTPQGNLNGFAFPKDVLEKFDPEEVTQFIAPLYSEELDHLSGLVEDWENQILYAVAVKSSSAAAWVLCADPKVLLDFRRRVGLGRLIQDIGENEEIAYILLQDEAGIISASKNITSMPRLQSDLFLRSALSNKKLTSRVIPFNGQVVFEVVKPFTVQGDVVGLIRVGLKMDAAHRAVNQTRQRAMVVGFGFLVIVVILFNFMVTHQNYNLLTEAYSKIKTYTGNILQNMADAVVAVNREGRITLFNRAAEKLFGKPSEQAIGKQCRDIIGKETSLLDETLASGQEVRDQEVSYQMNGHKVIFSVTTTLLRNTQGEIDSAVAVLKDLTEKRAWEERLRRQEKLTAMGELASGVAHEIRNPLNAISIIAQRLGWEFTPTNNAEEYRELVNSIVTETQRVSQTIERFLDFARPPKLDLRRLDLRRVAEKVVTLVESQAKEQGVSIRLTGLDELELLIDENQMEQVLLNLLQNSLQAMVTAGEITVRLSKNNQEAVVEVTDTGAGIPPDQLHRIFDLYFTTKEKGTGMGLSISHRIVTEHGGRIEVTSEVGKGSRFRIFLPLTTRNANV
jgi:PAS domain S-box-containing protein